jgi:hypothetical protein
MIWHAGVSQTFVEGSNESVEKSLECKLQRASKPLVPVPNQKKKSPLLTPCVLLTSPGHPILVVLQQTVVSYLKSVVRPLWGLLCIFSSSAIEGFFDLCQKKKKKRKKKRFSTSNCVKKKKKKSVVRRLYIVVLRVCTIKTRPKMYYRQQYQISPKNRCM